MTRPPPRFIEGPGKGSLRVRGEYLYGLYILDEKEIEILRIPTYVLANNADNLIRDTALDIVRLAVGDIIEGATGIRPSFPDGPKPAPESEKQKRK